MVMRFPITIAAVLATIAVEANTTDVLGSRDPHEITNNTLAELTTFSNQWGCFGESQSVAITPNDANTCKQFPNPVASFYFTKLQGSCVFDAYSDQYCVQRTLHQRQPPLWLGNCSNNYGSPGLLHPWNSYKYCCARVAGDICD
ncbi:hypothetical protein GQ53DRAFT_843308 [Thozetella sp. PMI_491]|nr:hypothetical protein GQ53DRAFT_843308 [Thozetella sp. PMI_491]